MSKKEDVMMRCFAIALILFCLHRPASATINFVQSNTGSNAGTTVTSLSLTLPRPTTQGNLIVAYVVPLLSQPGSIVVSDSGGNTYSPAASTLITNQCGVSQGFFYASNIAGGSDTITATIANAGGIALAVMEYSGVASGNPLDAQASSSQIGCASSSSPSSASLYTAGANELIVAGATISASGPSWAAGTGYTLRTGTTLGFAVADQTASTAGTYAASFSLSVPANWIASAIALKPSNQDGILCGLLDDGLPRLAPNWDTFMPPTAAGQTYLDPVFGCRVKRLTNSQGDETTWDGKFLSFMNYYSTFTPMNATDTMLFIISDDGNWRIKNIDGNIVVPSANTPIFSGHPLWDASNGNLFYYTSYNTLFSGTVTGNTIQSTPVHTFGEYSGIISPDAADLSQDGDHIALVGQNPDNTMDVFVWSLGQQMKTLVYRTTCTIGGNVTASAQPGCLHKLQLTADNLLTMGFMYDGSAPEDGNRLWTGSSLVHLQDKTDHYDTGYDLNGNSVFVAMNNFQTLATVTNPCPSGWGLDVRPLSSMINGQATSPGNVCLLDHPQYWHMSYRGSASQPWAAISFFDARPQGPEFFSNNVNYQLPPSASRWELYEDEIVLAKIDASAVYRLAHARSRSSEGYWAQPHASISRDGKYVIFTSTMAYPNGCPNTMHVPGQCSDVYLIKVR